MYAHISRSSWILPQRPLGRPPLVSITPFWPPRTPSAHMWSGRYPDFENKKYILWAGPPSCLVLFSGSVMSNSLRPHGLQHARLPCSPSPRACSNSCPLSRWCHSTMSSFVIPFSCPQFFLAQGLSHWVSFSHQVAKVLELQLQHQIILLFSSLSFSPQGMNLQSLYPGCPIYLLPHFSHSGSTPTRRQPSLGVTKMQRKEHPNP